ncbi:helix-turn-helix domain-containing protein [Poritiphilus flavus]|uniref:Helix-turn-helix domain-containing protein n=1 Tax=Poritiphilus flavus TaxID=2697053 RepID=A0A6L9E7D7_9FLAO|nr:helix-turn-helix domain-containing protein [Poritiphilus flavus]NAS10695.1 helix-turn-helix domain-containing protein [Poritiphilus flavus]
MKGVFIIVFCVFLPSVAAGFQGEIPADPTAVLYRCPPCGCSHDTIHFKEPGLCPVCNMELVEVPSGLARKIDLGLASYLEAGMLGQLYTKLIYPLFAAGILISLFLLFKRTRGKSLNVFLSLIILVLSLYGFKNQLFAVNYSLTSSYKSLFTPISFILWLGPLGFFYIRSLINPSFKWHSKYLMHFIPGILMFFYYSLLFLGPERLKLQFMFSPFEVRFSHTEQLVAVLTGLGYLAYAFSVFRSWRKTNPIRKNGLIGWIKRFLIGMTALLVSWGIMILINYWVYDFGVATVSYNPLWLVMGLVLLWLGIEVVSNVKFFLLNKRLNVVNSGRFLTETEISGFKTKLDHLMNEKKLYADPNLSLDALAGAMDLPPKYLSTILNNALGKNFYDFVNQYRIEEVKERLGDRNYSNLTIEAIANQSGFRSKSSFNAAFRKQMRMTPREYIKQQIGA